ncbi:hypothetical protein JL722_1389 [Aureococcus anophagefferens]|nr:hypothetical protein JL722_1389 [Aureococcus anophagefferens]
MDGDGEDLATFESDAESHAYGEREMVTPRLPAAEPEPPREAPGSAAKPLLDERRSLDDQGTPVQYTRALDDEEPETVAAPNFFVDGVAYRFADRALGCVPPSSEPRKRAVAVVVHPAFDAVILVAILVNAAFMGMVDYGSVGEDPDLEMYYKPKGGWRNDLIERAEIPFTALFLVEFVLKVFAMGFAGEEGAYLSDNWNLVDFVVVLTSVVELLPIGGGAGGLGALRAMRLLRPLRTLTRVPGLKKLVEGILSAGPKLVDVGLFFSFPFLLFGIVGVQLFMGQLHGRCRTTPYPVVANYSLYGNGTNYADFAVWYDAKDCYWPLDEDDGRFCALHTGGPGLLKCAHATSKLAPDEWRWCGSNYDALGNLRFTPLKKRDAGDGDGPIESWFHAGAKQGDDSGVWSEDLNFGYTSFDNYLLGLVTIFQTITLEGWSDVMFMYEDAGDPTVAALFFTCMVIFGSFILLNLVLAVLENSLEEEDDGAEAPDPEYEAACRRADELHEAGKYKSPFQKAVLSEGFDYFFTLLIVGNTIVLAMDHKGIDPAEERLHELILFVLGVLFAVEMVLKIAALGLAPYFAVSFNRFDAFIVFLSVLEVLLAPPRFLGKAAIANDGNAGVLSALRALRIFRVFKLAKSWKNMAKLLALLQKTLGDVANIAGILMLFMYICALLGMQLFANRFRFDGATGFANWNTVMYDGWRATGPAAFVFFFFVVVVGAFVVMQIFLAILLSNIMTVHEPETRDRSDTGREKVILLLILVSTAFLAIDSPLNAPCSTLSLFLALSDWFFTPIFIMEMVLKVIAVGAKPYIGNGWNQLDFLVVATSTYGLTTGAPTLTCTGGGSSVCAVCMLFFLVFAIFLVSFLKGRLRHCGDARFWEASEPPTYASLEDAGDDTVFGLLDRPKAWVDMSSDEQAYFGPSSGVGDVAAGCGDGAAAWSDDPYRAAARGRGRRLERDGADGQELCRCWGYRWTPVVSQSFDNVFVATLSLFEMATTEGWIDVMYAAVDSTGRANMPRRDENPGWYAVFLIFMLVGSFLFLNLFVGVVCSFEKMRGDKGGDIPPRTRSGLGQDGPGHRAPEAQAARRVVDARARLRRGRGVRQRHRRLHLAERRVARAALLRAARRLHAGDLRAGPLLLVHLLRGDGAEAARVRTAYFTSNWNRFDFGLVTITLVGLPLEFTGSGASGIGGFARMLRLARTVRLARLIKRHKTMQKLCLTLVATVPGLANIALLMVLMFFVFAVIGVNLFSKVAYYGAHDEHVNFRSLGRAMLSLLRFATGENWNGFMHDVARAAHCADDPEYDDDVCAFNGDAPGCVPVDGCGSTLIYPYLLSFSIVVAFVFVNLFIGVVLEGFNSADADDDLMISDEDYQRFRDGWVRFDTNGDGKISLGHFEALLADLPPPWGYSLGDDTPPPSRRIIQAKIQSLELEIFELGEQDMDEGDEGEAAHVKFNTRDLALAKHAHDTIVKVGSSSSTGAKRTALLRCFTEELVRGRGSSVDGRYALESPGVGDGYDDDEAKAPPNDYFFREPQEAPPSESPSWMPRGPPAPDSPHYADEAPDPPVDDGRVDLSYGGAALDGHAFELDLSENAFEGTRKALTALRALAKTMDDADGRMALALQCCGLGEAANSPDGPLARGARDLARADLEVLNLSDNNLGPAPWTPRVGHHGPLLRRRRAEEPAVVAAPVRPPGQRLPPPSDATRPLYDILQKSWDRDDLPSHWVKLEDDGDDFYAPPPATPRARAPRSCVRAAAGPLTPELATYRKSRVHVADPDVARVLSGSPDGWHDLRWSVPGDWARRGARRRRRRLAAAPGAEPGEIRDAATDAASYAAPSPSRRPSRAHGHDRDIKRYASSPGPDFTPRVSRVARVADAALLTRIRRAPVTATLDSSTPHAAAARGPPRRSAPRRRRSDGSSSRRRLVAAALLSRRAWGPAGLGLAVEAPLGPSSAVAVDAVPGRLAARSAAAPAGSAAAALRGRSGRSRAAARS